MQTLESLCSGKAACLKKFAQAVFSLEFKGSPDYESLTRLIPRV